MSRDERLDHGLAGPGRAGPPPVRCVRTGALREVSEHLGCPYCAGDAAAVGSGNRARFCEFRPGRDPVSFGFPPGGARLLHG